MGSSDRIEIVPYNHEWPWRFQDAKRQLSAALRDLAVSIDHIGSTSVPGLRAKDRIDIQITVQSAGDAFKQEFDTRLTSNGFPASRPNEDHRPPGDTSPASDWEKLYISGRHAMLPFLSNIHVRTFGRRNWRYPFLFRDYLRAHPNAAEAYALTKEKLARYLAEDRDAYTDAKDPVCDLIMVAAEAWADRHDWAVCLEDKGR